MAASASAEHDVKETLYRIQDTLFHIGAALATVSSARSKATTGSGAGAIRVLDSRSPLADYCPRAYRRQRSPFGPHDHRG